MLPGRPPIPVQVPSEAPKGCGIDGHKVGADVVPGIDLLDDAVARASCVRMKGRRSAAEGAHPRFDDGVTGPERRPGRSQFFTRALPAAVRASTERAVDGGARRASRTSA